jgi:hypothetical protein
MPLTCPPSEKLTLIYSSFIDAISLMFLEPFDWDHMTSIVFAVSHLFSYLWIFLEEKSSCEICLYSTLCSSPEMLEIVMFQ